MKKIVLVFFCFTVVQYSHAQFLKKLKEKVNSTVDKTINKAVDKAAGSKGSSTNETPSADNNSTKKATTASAGSSSIKVYSKFDFVPGKTILYFDNFENDNIGETPLGWNTSKSAETVQIEGLEGKWLKLANNYTSHISRNKKQSWGNSFTVEFDLLMKKTTESNGTYSYIYLFNSNGKLVSDESLLGNVYDEMKNATTLFFRLELDQKSADDYGHQFAVYQNGEKKSASDGEKIPYTENVPVHFSFCVQGKRYRVWLNNKKLYDLNAVDENALPNQLAFYIRDNAEYYLSNIRVAKDVPDTRAEFNQGKIVSNLLFYTGTANLKPESMGALLDVSKVIKDATAPVKIIGHTDSDGDDAANMKLSQQRAEAVKNILVKEYGIDESKLTTEGRGETQPLADNKTAEGKAQNRRVEFIFKADADTYQKPAGITSSGTNSNASTAKAAGGQPITKPTADAAPGSVKLTSKTVNLILPYAQISKGENGAYRFTASKEEGNSKENFFEIDFMPLMNNVRPETFLFKEQNQKKPLYGTKQYPEIISSTAVLYYNAAKKPYIKEFISAVANGHAYDIGRHLTDGSSNCKLVIEKVENGLASGYFVFGTHLEGLPMKKCTHNCDGEGSDLPVTDGYGGEIKGTFTNVPVY
ncbi:MAG: OmpA family protein [Sphingobacteriales bacterium]|nr:MAG: OmpA family protein [Sphingobacteriales bacterium]